MEECLNFIRRSKSLGVKIDIWHIEGNMGLGLFFHAFLPCGAHALSTRNQDDRSLKSALGREDLTEK